MCVYTLYLFFFLLDQLKSPLEAGQVSSVLTCHSFGDGLGAAGLELNCQSMGENTMKTEPASPLVELKGISTVEGSYLAFTISVCLSTYLATYLMFLL